MLTLRLARAGTHKRPVYQLVAADKRARRDGRFVENLGYYIPHRDILVFKQDRIDYWMGVGAQVTDTARRLIRQAKKNGNTEPVVKPKYVAPVVEAVAAKPGEKKAEPAEAKKAEAPAEKQAE